MCLLLRSCFLLATLPQRPDWWSAAEMVVLLEGSPISTEELWSCVRVTIEFFDTSLTKALLPRLLCLTGWPALERVLVVPNFFHWRMIEATVFLGNFNAADIWEIVCFYFTRKVSVEQILIYKYSLPWPILDNAAPIVCPPYGTPNHIQLCYSWIWTRVSVETHLALCLRPLHHSGAREDGSHFVGKMRATLWGTYCLCVHSMCISLTVWHGRCHVPISLCTCGCSC